VDYVVDQRDKRRFKSDQASKKDEEKVYEAVTDFVVGFFITAAVSLCIIGAVTVIGKKLDDI
jgi:hypothetical protein